MFKECLPDTLYLGNLPLSSAHKDVPFLPISVCVREKIILVSNTTTVFYILNIFRINTYVRMYANSVNSPDIMMI